MGINTSGSWTLLHTIIAFSMIAVLGKVNGEEVVGLANHTRNDMRLAPNSVVADSKTFDLNDYKDHFPNACDVKFIDEDFM
jgi:hypothetical protein